MKCTALQLRVAIQILAYPVEERHAVHTERPRYCLNGSNWICFSCSLSVPSSVFPAGS